MHERGEDIRGAHKSKLHWTTKGIAAANYKYEGKSAQDPNLPRMIDRKWMEIAGTRLLCLFACSKCFLIGQGVVRSHLLPAWGFLNCKLLMSPPAHTAPHLSTNYPLNIQFSGKHSTFGSVGKEKSVIWTVSKMNLMKSHWQEHHNNDSSQGYPVPRSFNRCVWA